MIFSGLQKLTLLDYPGQVACTLFTGGCNLRCPFCHNASLALPTRERDALPDEEILAFLKKRQGLLDGVAVTGGEPLLHPELPELLRKIKALGYKIKLDTNGTFPERLRGLIDAGLIDRVAMDIKAAPDKYALTVGVPKLDMAPIFESAALLLSGVTEYEFRTTAVRGLHEPEDFPKIGEWLRGADEYYIQCFIDSGDLIAGGGLSAFSKEDMQALAALVRPFVPSVKIRGL
ncbi:MAG: anaerobic ribonucleoside-triphosphate reductase activating protein [Oscillospiraceae bacterium]